MKMRIINRAKKAWYYHRQNKNIQEADEMITCIHSELHEMVRSNSFTQSNMDYLIFTSDRLTYYLCEIAKNITTNKELK